MDVGPVVLIVCAEVGFNERLCAQCVGITPDEVVACSFLATLISRGRIGVLRVGENPGCRQAGECVLASEGKKFVRRIQFGVFEEELELRRVAQGEKILLLKRIVADAEEKGRGNGRNEVARNVGTTLENIVAVLE